MCLIPLPLKRDFGMKFQGSLKLLRQRLKLQQINRNDLREVNPEMKAELFHHLQDLIRQLDQEAEGQVLVRNQRGVLRLDLDLHPRVQLQFAQEVIHQIQDPQHHNQGQRRQDQVAVPRDQDLEIQDQGLAIRQREINQ